MEQQNIASPLYRLEARKHGRDGLELVLWQLPCAATPQLAKPLRLAGLHGRNLDLVETYVRRRLHRAGLDVNPEGDKVQQLTPDEDLALYLGLLFRLLAPMRSAERIRQVTRSLEELNHGEAAYWLGMALHRKNPRRVLGALRLLLTA